MKHTQPAGAVAPVLERGARVPALDGLRGVAILGVLLFHTGHLPGGFLGVDLFFALSGYLITDLLLRETDRTGTISPVAFWGRRSRRLLPAAPQRRPHQGADQTARTRHPHPRHSRTSAKGVQPGPGARPESARTVELNARSTGKGCTRMVPSVVDRLAKAISTQDIEALVACFAPTFSVDWPVHQARSFSGPEQVRVNWGMLFKTFPSIQARIVRRVESGDEIWGEWEFTSEVHEAGRFWQRGIIIVEVDDELIVKSHFFMEPVEEAPAS